MIPDDEPSIGVPDPVNIPGTSGCEPLEPDEGGLLEDFPNIPDPDSLCRTMLLMLEPL